MEIKEMGSSTSADGEDKQAGDIYQLQVSGKNFMKCRHFIKK